jgi:hypothetical protein
MQYIGQSADRTQPIDECVLSVWHHIKALLKGQDLTGWRLKTGRRPLRVRAIADLRVFFNSGQFIDWLYILEGMLGSNRCIKLAQPPIYPGLGAPGTASQS